MLVLKGRRLSCSLVRKPYSSQVSLRRRQLMMKMMMMLVMVEVHHVRIA
jgi:hypothetical protein